MKKVFFASAAMAITIALTPTAFADSMALNHYADKYALTSNNPADQGNVVIDNAYIENTSAGKDLVITGFEFLLGGSGYSASDGLPEGGGSGWTYSLGAGAFGDEQGTSWSKNTSPDVGDAVKPRSGHTAEDYLSSVELISTEPNACSIGETLDPGQSCDVAIEVTVNYGSAPGKSSDTAIWGYAEGNEGTGTLNSKNVWKHGNTAVDNAMVENIHIEVAPTPEPRSLVLLGSGFGLVGLLVFLRHRRAASHHTIA